MVVIGGNVDLIGKKCMASEYKIVWDRKVKTVEDDVSALMDLGWEPLGGPVHFNSGVGQAVIKKEPATPKSKPAGATVRKKRVSKRSSKS